MDIVEINKYTQNKRVNPAREEMFERRKTMSKHNALVMILYACSKMYGVRYTAKLLHSIGVDNIEYSQ